MSITKLILLFKGGVKFNSVASTFKSHFTIIITLYQRYFFVVVDIYIIETQIQVIILYVSFHNSAPYDDRQSFRMLQLMSVLSITVLKTKYILVKVPHNSTGGAIHLVQHPTPHNFKKKKSFFLLLNHEWYPCYI